MPYQLVFANNPQLPSVTRCGPPGYENVTKSEEYAKNITALHLAREAFIKAESSQVLKKALKNRIHTKGDNVEQGDTIYYKKGNQRNWQGPDKVIAVNGKKLFIDKGSHVATVNRDDAVVQGEEFWSFDKEEDAKEEEMRVETTSRSDVSPQHDNEHDHSEEHSNDSEKDKEISSEKEHTEEIVSEGDNITQSNNVSQTTRLSARDSKRGDKLRFSVEGCDEVIEGQVLSRGGKVGGKYERWWNIENCTTGTRKGYDADTFTSIEKIPVESNEVEEVFVVQIPRFLHNEHRCLEAKEKELASWEEFDVYEEVVDLGQETLGTNWMLVEKIIDGKLGVKARLCVRGDQEKSNLRTDSPTVHKTSLHIFFMLAAQNSWRVQTSDIKCAFLQGEAIDRDVFLKPPKERRIKGVIWKMKKRAYGFTDAARGFYLELSRTLLDLNCVQSKFDPAVYIFYDEEGTLGGLILTHVDDLLHGSGNETFNEQVMKPLKQKFQFGSEEKDDFRYIGMHIKQYGDYIEIDQDHYFASLDFPPTKSGKEHEVMCEEDQTEFRSMLGRIGWLGNHSRPDLVFDHITLSTRLGKATYGDFAYARKTVKKMISNSTNMKFRKLGDPRSWVMDVYADAGYKCLPDEVSSCGGQVVLMRNVRTACVLSWRGRKLKRIVTSPSAAETLAQNDGISEMIFVKSLLGEIFGTGVVSKVPVHLYTDSKNVQKSVNSTAMVEDPRLRTEIAALKESIEKGEVNMLKRVDSKTMLANCLTKRGASAEGLLKVIRTGYLEDVMSE